MTALAQLSGALADRYRVERELGAGGMATVYLAHDLRHDRDVAIKVLHPELAAALGGERFLSEIKTTARLQHPHILPLLDSGEADGVLYYVMPFVAGETLRARLTREQQLPIDDAVRIAREVADALGAADALGIVHRDIKPENILLQGGHAVVADFGIALAVQQAGGTRLTQTGLSLGTPQYMSPEQAMGDKHVDARSDIYALGAVTYEMLTGDPPFTGTTVQSIVAKVMTERPTPPSTVRDTISPGTEHAVLKALAKLPADRFATAAEFATGLTVEGAGTTRSTLVVPDQSRALVRSRRTSVALAALALLGMLAAAWEWRRPAMGGDGVAYRLELTTSGELHVGFPIGGTVTILALSPAGDHAVFAVERPGGWALALRSMDQLTARVLPGTEGAMYPEFSPDGRWIAFEGADGTLKKIAVAGTSLTTICQIGSTGTAGLTWISDHEIVYSPRAVSGSGMFRVSAAGGTPALFSRADTARGERFQMVPRAADGGRLVFYGSTLANAADIVMGVVRVRDGRIVRFPALRGARALGLTGGVLVYVRVDGTLMAVPFDTRALTAGTPIQVGDSIAVRNWDAAAALSSSGALLYQQGGSAGQLVRVDPQGVASVLLDSVRQYVHPRFSPDGRHLAFEVTEATGSDIWTADLASNVLERITNGGANDRPEWTPDGKRITYTSSRETPYSIWWQPADGSASATKAYRAADPIREGMITPDGRAIVYRVDARASNRDIWLVPLAGDRTPVPLLNSVNDEKEPRVSPDSRWLAYISNESGREEVYVRALLGTGRVPVSAGGGGEPLWSPDGRRLYYRAGDRLMEATIATTPTLSVTSRRVVFSGPYASDIFHPNYDVAPDGKSFVMVRPPAGTLRVVMVINWIRELERRTTGGAAK